MKKTILTYGLISGLVAAVLMVVTMAITNRIGMERGYLVGYTAIVLSFLMVFFGIRSYRNHAGDGQITFAKGFLVGISITLISCICYVACWEIIYFNFMPDFMDKYAAHVIEKAQASGASAASIQAQIAQMNQMKTLYANPLINAAMTFIEPFPVGLIITLVSAAILRKQPRKAPTPETLPAAS